VDPPELDPIPQHQQTTQPYAAPVNTAQTGSAPPPPTSVSAQLAYDPNQAFGQGPGGLTGIDRIKPSDMPDEGLVGVSDHASVASICFVSLVPD
jgi:hypothetical protein